MASSPAANNKGEESFPLLYVADLIVGWCISRSKVALLQTGRSFRRVLWKGDGLRGADIDAGTALPAGILIHHRFAILDLDRIQRTHLGTLTTTCTSFYIHYGCHEHHLSHANSRSAPTISAQKICAGKYLYYPFYLQKSSPKLLPPPGSMSTIGEVGADSPLPVAKARPSGLVKLWSFANRRDTKFPGFRPRQCPPIW